MSAVLKSGSTAPPGVVTASTLPGSSTDDLAGVLDLQRVELKAKLVKSACEISAAARRYQKIHHQLFGFSMRRVLFARQPDKLTEFAPLEMELDSIDAESRRVRGAVNGPAFDKLPRHATTIVSVHDALDKYAGAVTEAAVKLNHICRSLRRESEGESGFGDYSVVHLRRDKAAYDDCVQDFKRWGARLTELFEKF